MPEEKDFAGWIIESGRRLYERGLIVAADGNLSCRMVDGRILITPSGLPKGSLRKEQLIVLSPEGKAQASPYRPSMETGMHLGLYRENPNIAAVVHCHAPFSAAYACAGRLPDLSLLPEGQGCIGSLQLLPYFPPGSSELAQAVAALARQGKCVLLAKHGLVAWGQSPAEALAIAEATEQLAKVNYLCEQLQRI